MEKIYIVFFKSGADRQPQSYHKTFEGAKKAQREIVIEWVAGHGENSFKSNDGEYFLYFDSGNLYGNLYIAPATIED